MLRWLKEKISRKALLRALPMMGLTFREFEMEGTAFANFRLNPYRSIMAFNNPFTGCQPNTRTRIFMVGM